LLEKENKLTRNKVTKRKGLKNKVWKIKKKEYSTFPDHLDAQPIPSTLSSLKFDVPLERCSTILSSQPCCLKGSSWDDDS
jgi:hypothetical protein